MSDNPQFDAYVQQLAREEVAKSIAGTQGQNQQTITQQAPEPLSLNIGGQTFNYTDRADLERALNQFVGLTASKLQEFQTQAEQAQTEQAGRHVSGIDANDEPKWSSDEFVNKMTSDPREGMRYYLNQELFDGKSEDVIGDLKRNFTETELTKRTIAAYQFKENHPEFPGGQQYANAIEKVRTELGLPYDYNGIEAAYLVAMQRQQLPNFYQPVMNQVAQQQLQAQQAQQAEQAPFINPQTGAVIDYRSQGQGWNGGAGVMQGIMNGTATPGNLGNNPYAAPPSPNRIGSGQAFAGGNVDYDSMSLPELENVLGKLGYPVQR